MAFKYVPSIGQVVKLEINKDAQPFKVKPGELTRWYIVNAGPNDGSIISLIGGITIVNDGSIKNKSGTQLENGQIWWVPPGSASVIESTFPEAGVYVGVGHAMNAVLKGGAFAVILMLVQLQLTIQGGHGCPKG